MYIRIIYDELSKKGEDVDKLGRDEGAMYRVVRFPDTSRLVID